MPNKSEKFSRFKCPQQRVFIPEDIDKFAKEHPQIEFYNSNIFGVRFLHEGRINSILDFISRVMDNLSWNHRIKLIDIGCGDGYILKEIKREFPNFRLFGIDLSETRLKRAEKLVPTAALNKGDVQNMPFNAEVFDIAICSEVIEHIRDDVGLLREIRRILKPRSFLILSTPNFYTFENNVKRILGKEVKISIPDHIREYSYNELIKRIHTVRFKIIKFQSIGFYIPKMWSFFRSKVLTKILYSFARLLPKMGRIFVILMQRS